MQRRPGKADPDEPRPSCHHCGAVLYDGQCTLYRGPLVLRGMGITYCSVCCLLDDIDLIEGRPLKTREEWKR